MKKMKILLALFVLFMGVNAFAQTKPKVICLVTKANWCPTCKANGERMGKEVFSSFKDGNVMVVANDLTDDASKKACKKDLDAAGITKVAESSNVTGLITLIDFKTKKIIETISVAKSSEEIKETINKALKRA